jgi:hypothetical protein
MLLCEYLHSAGRLDIIRNQRLLATDPATLNDPFEMYPGIIGTLDKDKTFRYLHDDLLPRFLPATKKALPDSSGELVLKDDSQFLNKLEQAFKANLQKEIEKGLERISQTLRVICFCDPNGIKYEGDDILLWSHYGDKHKGVRIFFETDDVKIRSTNLFHVVYSFERGSIDITDLSATAFDKNVEGAYRNTLRTKNKSWEYEQEVRWIINLEECWQESKRSYIPVAPKAIRRIDYGCRCDDDKILSTLADSVFRHVTKYRTSVHEHRFSLDY